MFDYVFDVWSKMLWMVRLFAANPPGSLIIRASEHLISCEMCFRMQIVSCGEAKESSLTILLKLLVSHLSGAPSVFECLLIFRIFLPAAQALNKLGESPDMLSAGQLCPTSVLQCAYIYIMHAYCSGVALCCLL